MKEKNYYFYILLTFCLIAFSGCKKASKAKDTYSIEKIDSLQVVSDEKNNTILLEKELQQQKIESIKETLDDIIQTHSYLHKKHFSKKTNTYELDFTYPYLDENYHHKFSHFNEYLSKELLNIKNIESDILETQELLCDSLKTNQHREKRIANYKVFLQDEKHLSILFYKENHYSYSKTSYYTFNTLNFDTVTGNFLKFEDYFTLGSEEEIIKLLNDIITENPKMEECFSIVMDDFMRAKNNFVINDSMVVYYFNDCIMCPSYKGTYQIEIPLTELKPFFKNQWSNRFEM